jgi:post-segregation antitoxin (ccd killing protein)
VATEHDNDEVCVPTVLVFDGFYTEHYRSVLQTAGCADPRRRRRRVARLWSRDGPDASPSKLRPSRSATHGGRPTNLDEHLDTARAWLDDATAGSAPDPNGLERRHRRRRIRVAVVPLLLVVAGVAGVALVRSADQNTDTVAFGTAASPNVAAPAAVPVEPTTEPAYVVSAASGWEAIPTDTVSTDLGSAFAGEEFTQVAVAFDASQDPLHSHTGELSRTIRISFGTYDEELREIYPGPGTPVTIEDREFEIVAVDRPTSTQVALVPVDLSQRTFLITAHNVETELRTTIAEGIDLTYDGAPISCFAYAWVFPYSTAELIDLADQLELDHTPATAYRRPLPFAFGRRGRSSVGTPSVKSAGGSDRRMIRRMPRLQVYLPDDLYDELKVRELPASELLQEAVRAELERRVALEATDAYLGELAAEVGEPSPRQVARADVIARRIRDRQLDRGR